MKVASKYEKVSPVEHVLRRPAMYVGSCTRTVRKDWAIRKLPEEGRSEAILLSTDTPYGIFHLFKELISNVADNVDESRKAGVPEGECEIKINKGTITISNGGLCIPIEMDEKEGMWIPQLIFGEMLSGSNLGTERTGGGAHGIGCKAVGALSSMFQNQVNNATQHKSLTCTWKSNYSVAEEPILKTYRKPYSEVILSYTVDHKRFGYLEETYEYSDTDIQMFHWIAACLAFTTGIPVTFCGTVMNYNLKSYAELYVNSLSENKIKHFTLQDENIKCIVLDTPGSGKHIGFANHIINTEGGIHVNAPITCIKEYFKSIRPEQKLTIRDIKPHVTVIISITGIVNPEWGGGQMKTSLTALMGGAVKLTIPDKQLHKTKTWGVVKYLDAKTFSDFGTVDPKTKKGKYLLTKRGEDATCAGTKESEKCELHVVEGDSAEGYDASLLDFIPGGRKYVGTLTLRGKPLNVLKASDESIRNNPELQEIARRLNIKTDIDYSIEANRKKLRYGRLVIMTDSDVDGQHIKALLLAFFYRFYPTLLEHTGFIVDYMTPYLRAVKGSGTSKKTIKFFYEQQYEQWKEENKDTLGGWKLRYFKGLGASEVTDIKEDYKDRRVVSLEYDEQAGDRLELAMGKGDDPKDATRKRKKWIREWDKTSKINVGKSLPISTFVDYFVRNYSYSTLSRNTPTMMDGFTDVSRKIIFGAFESWGRQCTSTKLLKVTDFAGAVGIRTAYHHGDSIQHSVITLAQDFPGSNNLPMLIGKGRFGSMEKGGKHAAQPRYLEVHPSPLLPYIFRPEDDTFHNSHLNESDGKSVEPRYFIPIIPMALINGVDSVSTGWRSRIPNYHPLDIIDQYLDRLDGLEFIEPTPWYRGYKGTVGLYDDEEGMGFYSEGIVTFINDDSYILECLPVGVWNNKYKKKLLKGVLEGTIKDYESQCTATKTYFKVEGYDINAINKNYAPVKKESVQKTPVKKESVKNEPVKNGSVKKAPVKKAPVKKEPARKLTKEDIGVIKKEKLSNITLLGPSGFPDEYANVAAVMEEFYNFRLPLYTIRKTNILKELAEKLLVLQQRREYIQAYHDKKLLLTVDNTSRNRNEILSDIDKLNLKRELYLGGVGYKKVAMNELDKDGILCLNKEIQQIEDKIKEVESVKETDVWKSDLNELRIKYTKLYPE